MTWREKFGAKLRPAAAGAAQVLGELEADVMAVLWATHRPLPVREVRDRLAERGRELAYNTVMTVLVRLSEKGLLERDKHEDMWHYAATLSESDFRAQVSGEVLRSLLDLAPEATLAQLVDVLAEDEPEALDQLVRLIEARRTQTSSGDGDA